MCVYICKLPIYCFRPNSPFSNCSAIQQRAQEEDYRRKRASLPGFWMLCFVLTPVIQLVSDEHVSGDIWWDIATAACPEHSLLVTFTPVQTLWPPWCNFLNRDTVCSRQRACRVIWLSLHIYTPAWVLRAPAVVFCLPGDCGPALTWEIQQTSSSSVHFNPTFFREVWTTFPSMSLLGYSLSATE